MKQKILVASFVWLIIIGFIALTWNLVFKPKLQEKQVVAQIEQEKQKLVATSSDSRYKTHVSIAMDSFSGYAPLRSNYFKEQLAAQKIKINTVDTTYTERMQKVISGECPLATFTIDSFVKTIPGTVPATIVCVLDETVGADAICSYKDTFVNVDQLNDGEVKFVVTEDSPSEMLVRAIYTHFNLSNIDINNCFLKKPDVDQVYDFYRKSKPEDKQVYVAWTPYVDKILENPNMQIIIDTSKLRGYIVDVLVANRDYLFKNADTVSKIVEAYFKTVYKYRDNMAELILEDAKANRIPINQKQAEELVSKIWWKNTQENYAHLGLLESDMIHLEDMIGNITNILLKTKAIPNDPTGGATSIIYFDGLLKNLHNNGFHPGHEKIRQNEILVELSNEQWDKLAAIGTLEVPPLSFVRGSAKLTEQSTVSLEYLLIVLNDYPFYYLKITGNSSNKGDVEANKQLAFRRAESVKEFLISRNVNPNRLKTLGEVKGESSVVFSLGQLPY